MKLKEGGMSGQMEMGDIDKIQRRDEDERAMKEDQRQGVEIPIHDPAECLLEACSRCGDYWCGYDEGKAAAFVEIQARLTDKKHSKDDGCPSCVIIRAVRLATKQRKPKRPWSVVID